jgi:hypothetical protein
MRCPWIAALLLSLPTPLAAAADPVFSDTGPDAAAYGAAQNYPVGGHTAPAQPQMARTYSHYDRIWSSHLIIRADTPSPLHRAPQEIALTYRFNGATHTLDDYLAHNPVIGLLIARDDTILFEHYQYAQTDQDHLLPQSRARPSSPC